MRRLLALLIAFGIAPIPALAQSAPDLIFRKSTNFRLLTPDDRLATYGIDDPVAEGVACHYTVPERGGVSGMFGVADERTEVSLACRQVAPIRFRERFSQGDLVFSEARSIWFKRMRIVRGCDARRNVLVYMVYTDRLIDGFPQNSTSTVPIMPWGPEGAVQRCQEFVK